MVEEEGKSTNVQQVNKTKESSKKSTIYKSLVDNSAILNPEEASTIVAIPNQYSSDVKQLDIRVKALMEKSQKMISNGPLKQTKAFVCKVCGKEGRPSNIRNHIEANHLDGIALPCDNCGKTFSARQNLSCHKTKCNQN